MSGNDATASSYGWNFQCNCAILFFCKNIKNINSIKVESKNQDIDIYMKDGSCEYIQVKSVQDINQKKNIKAKLKDALISLSAVDLNNNDKLIYVSNIEDAFLHNSGYWNNCMRSYSEFSKSAQLEIDDILQDIVAEIDKEISKCPKPKKLEKLKNQRNKILNFCKEKFKGYVVFPYFGDEDSRYIKVKDEIIDLLVNVLNFDTVTARKILIRIIEHWQNIMEHNSTVKNMSYLIDKKKFTWPIVVFSEQEDNIIKHLREIPNTQIDSATESALISLLASPRIIFLESFECSNKIINAYKSYKTLHHEITSSIENSYIAENWTSFVADYPKMPDDLEEPFVKTMMLKVLLNRYYIDRTFKGVDL